MSDTPTPSSPVRGVRTFRVACFVLVAAAAAQAVAAAMALKQHRHPRPGPVAEQTPPAEAAPAVETVAPEELDPFDPNTPPPPGLPENWMEELARVEVEEEATSPEPVVAEPVKPAPLDVPITDETCLRHLDEGIYLKEKGDMQGALEQFRAALKAQPNHPRLIFHLASTLELMGLTLKARAQWEALKRLGDGAGEYYEIAMYRLHGDVAGVAVSAETETVDLDEKEGRLVFAGVESWNAGAAAEGEVRTFRLTIERRQEEPVDVSKVGLAIHFFDEVNGRRIDRSTTMQPEVQWETAETGAKGADDAVDWANGRESGVFEYRQPPMTPDEVMRYGRRKYLGYVIELYYEDKLQDVSASVPQLLEFARELPVDDGRKMERVEPVSAPGQPDNALFPGDYFGH